MYTKLTQLIVLIAVVVMSFATTSEALAGSSVCGGNVTVVSGDTLRKIADRCGTTVSALQLANGISNANVIYVGQVLVLPGALLKGSGNVDVYIVARGETMRILADRFVTTVDGLLKLNPTIYNANLIYEGQRLNVPAPGSTTPTTPPTPPAPPAGGTTYTVQSGDTLRKIADRLNITVDALLKVNPQITNANLIYAGQKINLPAGISAHIVQKGDTLKAIATKYGTTLDNLLALNPQITNANLIYVGQVIRLK
jgi:LysM repeat protein